MKAESSILLKLLVVQCLVFFCVAQGFDFFYFVQQWPGSYCDTKKSCCYPKTGKPDSNFGVHGLWPNYENGSYPSNCDPRNPFDKSKISDLVSELQNEWPTLACPSGDGYKFWEHEWEKHGTCSESVLDQHDYFGVTLDLKEKSNLLQALTSAGINPDDEKYSLEHIKDAIKESVGYEPWIECNKDADRISQLYQVYLCVDTSGKNFIDCPVFPRGSCAPTIQFPTF
ncbi:Ribonuclease T2-like [Dillenia turbinata]|uniref:Ribonuclease T2-like n=1 Tax=Dillenia turbinata TaxID=194707 RepID=A0AAN8UU21_9MAGN